MTISETNKLWLTRMGKTFQVPPEAILNLILDRVRQRDQDEKQGLMDWADAAGKAEALTSEQLEQLQRVLSESESAVKATQLYLSLIQTNQSKES